MAQDCANSCVGMLCRRPTAIRLTVSRIRCHRGLNLPARDIGKLHCG